MHQPKPEAYDLRRTNHRIEETPEPMDSQGLQQLRGTIRKALGDTVATALQINDKARYKDQTLAKLEFLQESMEDSFAKEENYHAKEQR